MIVFAVAAGDGAEADGDFTLEVAAGCVQRQTESLAGFLVLLEMPCMLYASMGESQILIARMSVLSVARCRMPGFEHASGAPHSLAARENKKEPASCFPRGLPGYSGRSK